MRKLGGDILNAKDPVRYLISLLQAVTKEDQEEIRIRHEECFVAKIRLSQRDPPATDQFKLTQG